MAKKTREVEASLLRKGFRADDSHHRYFVYHTLAGKKTAVSTYTSQGSKELDDYLIGQMAKQCKLTKKEFGELVDCPMTQAAYEEALIKKEHVSKPSPPVEAE